MARKKTAIDFEKSLQTLEQLVESMESGEMTLEKSLQAFEDGIKLTKECQQALLEAEQKVAILLANNGEETLESFEEDGEDQ